MTGSLRDKALSLTYFEVLFYLVLVPLSFTYAVHFISSKNMETIFQQSKVLKVDVNKISSYSTDYKVFRELLPFYNEGNKYKIISETNELFNYTLPLLGTQEFKIIKAKEEVRYVTQAQKVQTVNFYAHTDQVSYRR